MARCGPVGGADPPWKQSGGCDGCNAPEMKKVQKVQKVQRTRDEEDAEGTEGGELKGRLCVAPRIGPDEPEYDSCRDGCMKAGRTRFRIQES